jgi:beta-mannosidase
MAPERWPHLDWEGLAHTHGLQKAIFDRVVPPAEHATFDGWRSATQAYQAVVVRRQIEALRRIKYRPTGGFAQFCFADAHPAVSWSVLDHDRVPKAAFHALREACRPVIVVADRLAAELVPGDALALDVHVVSDLRQPVEDAEVTAELQWGDGRRSWRWGGDLPADGCEWVGTLQVVVPDVPGPMTLILACRWGDQEATNCYEATIVPT